ncbi:TPA: serine hydrolase [Candidatus Latescibacteria bacterium]|nr:serine hydrolase [Candidatus Latescibacterota bacterium]
MSDVYWPSPVADWKRLPPSEAGFDSDGLAAAIKYAEDPANAGSPPDLGTHLVQQNTKNHDDGVLLGPTQFRGPATGVILRNGYLIAEWGDPHRVDMTFSISKSFLSTCAGLAFDRGLIEDLDEPVGAKVGDGGYDSDHNGQITWDHSLRQISEWDGTLFDKHHSAGNPDDERTDPVTPGTRYEYNDVRVNRFALSLLRVWKRPLPDLLREEIMDPIGASDSWHWHGYANSWVEVEGQRVQSVSGGGHWGGGMWISAYDQARFGLFSLRKGVWEGKQLLSPEWIRLARTKTELRPTYGFMNWFLNTGRELVPSAPESCFYHGGAGTNRIMGIPELDLVVVSRWIDGEAYSEFVNRLLFAVD